MQEQGPIGSQPRRLDCGAGELGERHRLDRFPVGVGVAGEGDELGHEVGELVHLEADAVGHLAALVVGQALGARQQLGVRLQARQGCPQLVARVGDESLLAGAAVGERVDHRGEARGETPDLAGSAVGQLGVESAGLRDVLGRVTQPGDRADEPNREQPAEQRGEDDPTERVEREPEA